MLTVLDHSLIKHKLSIMRNKDTSTYIFKRNLDEIAKLMAYEVTITKDKEKALEYAKKVLELRPEDESVQRIIDVLSK